MSLQAIGQILSDHVDQQSCFSSSVYFRLQHTSAFLPTLTIVRSLELIHSGLHLLLGLQFCLCCPPVLWNTIFYISAQKKTFLVIAYTPNWKFQEGRNGRNTTIQRRKHYSLPQEIQCNAKQTLTLERRTIYEYADHIPQSHLFANIMDSVQLFPLMSNIPRKPFK